MQEITRSEVEKLVALQSNKYKKDVALILDTYYTVIREAILAGLKVTIPGVCSFSNSEVSAKGERTILHPVTLEEIIVPGNDPYNKPSCRFKPSIKSEMRELTEGRVF